MPQPGEVWLADIPFTNGTASKLRPVLVLWTDAADVVVAAITSALPRTSTDVALQNWAAAGLRVASTARMSRLDCLAGSMQKKCKSLRRGFLRKARSEARSISFMDLTACAQRTSIRVN